MNDTTYEMARPSGQHGKGFYVKSTLLLAAVGALCILVGVLGKRVHDKTSKCEAEKEAAVSCDSATTTQKVIDGVAQCVPILSCETGVVNKAGVCESNESNESNNESQRMPAFWVVLVLFALILAATLLFVRRFRRKGKQGTAVIGGEIEMNDISGGYYPLTLETEPLANLPTTKEPLSGPRNSAELQRAIEGNQSMKAPGAHPNQRRSDELTGKLDLSDLSEIAERVALVQQNAALKQQNAHKRSSSKRRSSKRRSARETIWRI